VKNTDGSQVTTWGLGDKLVNGSHLTADAGKTEYKPFDSMTFTVNGSTKTLNAFANVGVGGKQNMDGPFQCTALVSSYMSDLGFKKAGVPNGRDVASSIAQGENGKYFQYSKVNGLNVEAPRIGSIVSMETGHSGKKDNNVGHVAIIKDIKQNKDGSLTATMIEQNVAFEKPDGTTGWVTDRTIKFEKSATGEWSAQHTIKPGSSFQYDVRDWVTPVSAPPE
jgi:hypothetical protein